MGQGDGEMSENGVHDMKFTKNFSKKLGGNVRKVYWIYFGYQSEVRES